MSSPKHDERGIPILTLSEKIDALRTCLIKDSPEDSLGHLFDLINFVAPGYQIGQIESLAEIAYHYGRNPVLVEKDR